MIFKEIKLNCISNITCDVECYESTDWFSINKCSLKPFLLLLCYYEVAQALVTSSLPLLQQNFTSVSI